MNKFIVTFSWANKEFGEGYIVLENAQDLNHAIRFVQERFPDFVHIYKEEDFHEGVFRKGCLETHNLQNY